MRRFEEYAGWQKKFLRKLAAPFAAFLKRFHHEFFTLWEDLGLHVTPNHFYSPIPDTRYLTPDTCHLSLSGMDLDIDSQREYLDDISSRFKKEWEEISMAGHITETGFFLGNGRFDGIDALFAHGMVRSKRPGRIIEIGSGFSTRILSFAGKKNGGIDIWCIDPFADESLKGLYGVNRIYRERVETFSKDFFSCLKKDDILFIDSSHIVRTGSDVIFLVLEVLPNLKKGVIVHFHDIFFPMDYPLSWIKGEHRFWSEQYLLAAFLVYNKRFKAIFSSSLMGYYYPDLMKGTFPLPEELVKRIEHEFSRMFPGISWWGGGSFWGVIE